MLPVAGVVVTTITGSQTSGNIDGTGTAAQFSAPQGIAVGPSGVLYVADSSNNQIRKITPAGKVTTLAGSPLVSAGGDGQGTAASFVTPTGIVVTTAGIVYVGDFNNHK